MAKMPPDLSAHVARAKRDRRDRQEQINRFLQLADPSRPRIGDNAVTAHDRGEEIDDLFDCTLQEVYEDFGSDLIARLMPRHADWLTYAPLEGLRDEDKKRLEKPLKERSTRIFDAIRGSNFYDEAAGEWALDQAHGTSALIITDPGAAQPFYCEAIPPSQLLIARGAKGVNFRARECVWTIADAVAYWPTYWWSAKDRKDAADPEQGQRKVRMLLSATLVPDPGDEIWLWRVCADDVLVYEERLVGVGSCPIIASRWRTHSSSAWGLGPLLKAVPDALTLDQERYLVLKNMGKTVDPPVMYDDDGVLNPEGGVGAGMWIPRLPGSKIDRLEPGRIEAAYYEQGYLQDSIRRAGFQYGPRQRGKTPPTLGQWMDEKAEEGRRLEMPTGKLYSEGVIAIVQRFEYLLVKRGEIDPYIALDGRAPVRVRPQNPLSRQQDFEEIQTAQQLLQFFNSIFGPQALAATVDGPETLEQMRTRLNDKLIVVRDAEDAAPLLNAALGVDPAAAAPAGPPPGAA